jgi:KipI family sensor histidine kinase inhibitor
MSEDLAAGELNIRPLAESGLLVEFPNVIEPAVVERVMALTAALDVVQPPGLHDIVPSYRTIQLAFDPLVTDGDTLAGVVRRLAAASSPHSRAGGREVTIPVAYGGAQGPDLADVAAYTGLARDEVCARHAMASYRVACMGFAPGFGYLVGLPPELETPRRATPRTRVPAGSVAIGGAQTGVYPSELPGGWNIIGRTPVTLFDVARPEPFLIKPGDHVRFAPISSAEYEAYLAGADETTGPVAG